jgi:DNA-binding transcriptional ArsR family regulator
MAKVMAGKYEKVGETLKALAHAARLQIVTGLMKNECNVSEIQKTLRLPQSTISQHLRILRNQGIIRSRREGTKMCYRVVDKRVRKIMRMVAEE